MPTNTLIDFRESVEASVDTWEVLDDRGDETGFDFRVPSGVSAISRLRFACGLDLGTTASLKTRILTAFKLLGEGLKESGPYGFLGPFGGIHGTTNHEVSFLLDPMEYLVNIPVNAGQEFQVQAKMLGEDVGAINPLLEVTYNPLLQGGQIRKADVREGDRDSATTDSLAVIQTDLEGTTKDFKVPAGASRVIGLLIALAPDHDAENPLLTAIELAGDGLLLSDPVNILGPAGGYTLAGTSVQGFGNYLNPRILPLALPVKPGFEIQANLRTMAEDSGPVSAGIGLLYG